MVLGELEPRRPGEEWVGTDQLKMVLGELEPRQLFGLTVSSGPVSAGIYLIISHTNFIIKGKIH